MGLFGSLGKTLSNIGESIGWSLPIVSDILQNQANEDAQRRQQEFDTKMWNLQNEYNTPANQVARLRAAGLNPNLFYSQGNPGNATSHPTTQAVRYQYDFGRAIDKMSMLEQMKNLREQNKNLQAQNRNIDADTALKKSADRKNIADAKYKEAVIDYYLKYERWPDQSVASTVMQAVQNGTGLSSHNIEFLRDAIWKWVTTDTRPPEDLTRTEIKDKVNMGFVFDRNEGRWIKLKK